MLTVLPRSLPPKRLSFFLLTSQHRAGADAVELMCRRRRRKRVDSAQGRPAHWFCVRPWRRTRTIPAGLVRFRQAAQEALGGWLCWVDFAERPRAGRIAEMTAAHAIHLPAQVPPLPGSLPWLSRLVGALFTSTSLHHDAALFTFAPGCWSPWTTLPSSVFLPSFSGRMAGRRISSLITRMHGLGTMWWKQHWPHPVLPLLTHEFSSYFLFPYPWPPGLGKSCFLENNLSTRDHSQFHYQESWDCPDLSVGTLIPLNAQGLLF